MVDRNEIEIAVCTQCHTHGTHGFVGFASVRVCERTQSFGGVGGAESAGSNRVVVVEVVDGGGRWWRAGIASQLVGFV